MNLEKLSISDLVSRFEKICLVQFEANLEFNTSRYNRAFDSMMAISEELRSRPGDQRRALVTLYDHPNEQVRLKAAIHTLALFPEEACGVLQKLIDDRIHPQAMDAGMILDSFKEGRYVPD